MSDEAAGEFEERFVEVGSPFPADAQASVAVQPGRTPLHDPAASARPSAMPGAAAGDRGRDATSTDLVAVDVVVVAAGSANSESGLRRGRPTRPQTGGTTSTSGSSWVASLRFPSVSTAASGVPCPSVIK